jgi:hypothetical protein
MWAVPKSTKGRIFWAISFPLMLAFTYTIPDCRKESMKKWYIATFAMAIVWLGILVEFMVEHAVEGFNEVPPIGFCLKELAINSISHTLFLFLHNREVLLSRCAYI